MLSTSQLKQIICMYLLAKKSNQILIAYPNKQIYRFKFMPLYTYKGFGVAHLLSEYHMLVSEISIDSIDSFENTLPSLAKVNTYIIYKTCIYMRTEVLIPMSIHKEKIHKLHELNIAADVARKFLENYIPEPLHMSVEFHSNSIKLSKLNWKIDIDKIDKITNIQMIILAGNFDNKSLCYHDTITNDMFKLIITCAIDELRQLIGFPRSPQIIPMEEVD